MSNERLAAITELQELVDANTGPSFGYVHRLWLASKELLSLLDRLGDDDQPHCWHCRVVLDCKPILRCEDCPDECDLEGCGAFGCGKLVAGEDEG